MLMLTVDWLRTLTTAQLSTFPKRPLTSRTCTLQTGLSSRSQSLYTDALLHVRSHNAQTAISCLVRALLQVPKEKGVHVLPFLWALEQKPDYTAWDTASVRKVIQPCSLQVLLHLASFHYARTRGQASVTHQVLLLGQALLLVSQSSQLFAICLVELMCRCLSSCLLSRSLPELFRRGSDSHAPCENERSALCFFYLPSKCTRAAISVTWCCKQRSLSSGPQHAEAKGA